MDTMRCGCCAQPIKPKEASQQRATAGIRLVIAGMGCPNCTVRVHNALVSVDGVAEAQVSLMPPITQVLYDGKRVTEDEIIAAVATAGRGTHHLYRAKALNDRRPGGGAA